MSKPIAFNSPYTTETGVLQQLTPWLRRITAPNPSAFTYRGTGTYVIGRGTVVVIDPGPAIESHIDAMLRALAEETISHILVTHAHLDHSPACALLQRRVEAPIYAYAVDSEAIGRNADAGYDTLFKADVSVADGDCIYTEQGTFECVHTPGHTSDHLCFSLHEQNALFCGDHVMGWSTSIVSPPDGNMGDYMRSLQRLRQRTESIYWPTHGGPIEQPQQLLEDLIQHRLEREAQILSCVGQGYSSLSAMLPVIYAEIDPALYPAAERSLLAAIAWLNEQGKLHSVKSADGEIIYQPG